MENKCPVPAPKLLKADSLVETCASCGAWVNRYPAFFGESDRYWQCDKCGCTSVKIRDGRPYGSKSRQWEHVVIEFNELYLDIAYWDWDTVVTDPPMHTLDWAAVETWFRSQNIHRVFISFGEITEFASAAPATETQE